MGIVNQLDVNSKSPRLSDVLFEKSSPTFASMAPLASNVEAIEAALLFSAGFQNHVALVGPSGWGKSHLLAAIDCRLRQEGKDTARPAAAEKFLESQPGLATPLPLLLDDCQEVLGNTRLRSVLRLTLESRVRSSRPTFVCFTSSRITRQIRNFLPQQRDWSLVFLGGPEPMERIHLINQMAAADNLTLSPNLVRIMAHQMHGNGRTVSGALKRLRLSGASWMDGFAVMRACGLLEPFFADNGGWDLKYRIIRAAEEWRGRVDHISHTDLAVYAMLRIASLSEADVARAMDAEPAAVYLRASRFEREMERDSRKAAAVGHFVDSLVTALTQE